MPVTTSDTATPASGTPTIIAAARTMCPHDALPNVVDARVGDKIPGTARKAKAL
jgi:hypothetical protein